MATIDNELKSCGGVALLNAFHAELNSLVARYRHAAQGLSESHRTGLATFVESGQALVEAHAWGADEHGTLVAHEDLPLWGDWTPAPSALLSIRPSCGYATLMEAFADDRAERIGLHGKILFLRKDGEWMVAQPHEQQP